jgi:regulator of protease activity HflC (stomatin/prohibitin superfamily)
MRDETVWIFLAGMCVLCVIVFILFLGPMLQPWWAEQEGKAELAQAEQNRQIAVLEATAKYESSKQLALAEIERAKGVAEANRIIGDSLKGNEDYLRYLYISGITENNVANREIIYLPTEAGIPILEANRINTPAPARVEASS